MAMTTFRVGEHLDVIDDIAALRLAACVPQALNSRRIGLTTNQPNQR
jgi:hypothetical protein